MKFYLIKHINRTALSKIYSLKYLLPIMVVASMLNQSCTEEKSLVSTSPGNISFEDTNAQCYNGVSLTSPPGPVEGYWATAIKNTAGANYVAIIPFALGIKDKPLLHFNKEGQWWGEKPTGVKELIRQAKKHSLKVMLKPQVWFHNTWPGDFSLASDEEWQVWEQKYRDYILTYAKIASEQDISLFCVGTEFKNSAVQRPGFWKELIKMVREVYAGKLIYAANWDNYQNISFWEELDYIGVDAYFPLLQEEIPAVNRLMSAWEPIAEKLSQFSMEQKKKIIFTEYGYRSMTFTTWKAWEKENDYSVKVSMEAQKNAYEAIFQTFWDKKWFAGGFLWKWYTHDIKKPGADTDYTPQKKPVLKIIKKVYSSASQE